MGGGVGQGWGLPTQDPKPAEQGWTRRPRVPARTQADLRVWAAVTPRAEWTWSLSSRTRGTWQRRGGAQKTKRGSWVCCVGEAAAEKAPEGAQRAVMPPPGRPPGFSGSPGWAEGGLTGFSVARGHKLLANATRDLQPKKTLETEIEPGLASRPGRVTGPTDSHRVWGLRPNGLPRARWELRPEGTGSHRDEQGRSLPPRGQGPSDATPPSPGGRADAGGGCSPSTTVTGLGLWAPRSRTHPEKATGDSAPGSPTSGPGPSRRVPEGTGPPTPLRTQAPSRAAELGGPATGHATVSGHTARGCRRSLEVTPPGTATPGLPTAPRAHPTHAKPRRRATAMS